MEAEAIATLVNEQRQFFLTGATLPVEFRLEALRTLQAWIRGHEQDISAALKADLGKGAYESYMCEVGLVLSELSFMLRHTAGYARPRRVRSSITQLPGRSYVQPSPFGTVLVMSPWNYPFMLTVDPLIDALAAGNTAVLKPSDYSPATSAVIAQMVAECFPSQYVAVVTGGRAENTALLDQPFDMVFFTGSQQVGKVVLRHCAERLTPATLELGGKSPCIVDETASIPLAARRIVFGKFLNCGQTCVAPDYILVHESVKGPFLKAVIAEVKRQFGADPLENPNYGRIVNQHHFQRLLGLIDPAKVVMGGQSNLATLQIAPTVMEGVSFEDAVMGEEIFGPIMPVITYRDLDEELQRLALGPSPLAFYLFTSDGEKAKRIMARARFGGGCINDVVVHLATSHMGFGGIGASGMGAYHGKVGFDTFSHRKSIVNQATWMDVPLRYQPYGKLSEQLLRLVLR